VPRSKTHVSKLPRDLRDPIEFGRPSLAWDDAQVAAWFKQRHAFVLTEQMRKLDVLIRELNPEAAGSPGALMWLCIELAKKLYPGFCTELDGVARKGRPRRGKDKEGGALDDPTAALMFVEQFRKAGKAESDLDACKILAGILDESLLSPARKSALERKARSLASVVSTTRASAKRKAEGRRQTELRRRNSRWIGRRSQRTLPVQRRAPTLAIKSRNFPVLRRLITRAWLVYYSK